MTEKEEDLVSMLVAGGTNFFSLDPTLSRASVEWNAPSDSLTNTLPLGARNVRGFDTVQFRVGVDFRDPDNPTTIPSAFSIALSDGASTVSVSTGAQLGNNDLFFPPGTLGPSSPATTVQNTLRVPLSLFSGINLGDLRSVELRFNGTASGTVLISDLAFANDLEASPRCQSSQSFAVGDRAHVTTPGGGFSVANAGGGLAEVGFDAATNGILSVGPVQVRDRAVVTGDVVSNNALTIASTAVVTGVKSPFTPVVLPPLPTLPAFPPPTGGNITVNWGTLNLAAGSYASVTVNGGTLRLAAGTYFIQNLTINSGTRVEVNPLTRVLVRTSLAYRSPFVNAANAVQPIFLGFAGTSDVSLEARFDGTLVAPASHVSFGTGPGLTYTGAFFARILEVRPQNSLVCTEGPP